MKKRNNERLAIDKKSNMMYVFVVQLILILILVNHAVSASKINHKCFFFTEKRTFCEKFSQYF